MLAVDSGDRFASLAGWIFVLAVAFVAGGGNRRLGLGADRKDGKEEEDGGERCACLGPRRRTMRRIGLRCDS